MLAEPELLPTAVEEFLRAFASVSLWRTVTQDSAIGDTPVEQGDTVMMTFPAACRDPEAVWLEAAPDFALNPAGQVTWAEGAICDPRTVPVIFG